MKKTPLYETHLKYGGRIIDFEGWALPVQFSSIKEEHHACRNAAALWDVSDMGEIMVEGDGALDLLQMLLVNDISKGYPGRVIYTPMCYPTGGVVDDMMVVCLKDQRYLLVVNAGNIEKDYEWISNLAKYFYRVSVKNLSADIAEVALQGPNSERILQKLVKYPLNEIKYYHGVEDVEVAGIKCLITRTGYTGEDGFEIYCKAEEGPHLFEAIMEAGENDGLVPAGLGCRDTLRFEASMPLYGQELDAEHTPLEAGLGRFVAFNKGVYFVGSRALMEEREKGLRAKLVGLEMVEKGVPRTGYKVFDESGEKELGYVTTGSYAPTLDKYLAMAFVPVEFSQIGTKLRVDIRGKKILAEVVKMPFYRREGKKK
ncbi:MAG: glycine cleavage system aminomethyltransferase GcvT [Candidatus Fermentithermobacillus carboniphilus]|uniref:Aminomethyltransferase n=1 Tax=Candidatus Fermentithermobacillus carboniphilus TaxID=3085328 RepID=A0AAT9LH44_9FIRM|nr:MAG: glycine cleavage system aminomethyltransferase GcvT [Candidatus Fermentithermobacillus carboniphilus]